MGTKVFGRREGVPYRCNASAGIEDQVFAMLDSTATLDRSVKVATAGATFADGVVGVVQTGIWHGHFGTSADKYPENADLNVVSNGQVRVKISQTTVGESDYLADGNLVKIASGGKAAKWTAPTISPSMTANFGTTDLGAIITADITHTLSSSPTAVEVKAWLEAVIEALIAAEATLCKAYITEFVSEYVAAFEASYRGIVGRCVGDPSGGVVTVELLGLGGIQQG